jgi:protein MAK11
MADDAPSPTLVIGTYDGHVLAFAVHPDKEEGSMLAPILGIKAHQGSVRSVCTSGRYAVSASSDETMSVFDLVKVVDLGQLYTDSVGNSVVAMYGGSHLVSGSDGGRVAIFRSSDWEQLTSMSAHPTGVVDIAIHPSGRLALSVGKEAQLYTWNLMRAKCVLKRPLSRPATAVRWSPSGTGCAVLSGSDVLVLDLTSDQVANTFAHSERVLAFDYLTDSLLITGNICYNIIF